MQEKKYVLVLSGGGAKGLYTCGVLKAIEKCGLKSQIEAVYGVSAGALIGAFWLSGWSAEEILEKFLASDLFSMKNIALPPKFSLLRTTIIENLLDRDVKDTFEELELPLYVGASDVWKPEFRLFSTGEIKRPVLASLAIPGIFPAVEYDGGMLVDGGVMCNFPLTYAQKDYPQHETIGVYLGQYQQNQPVNSLIDGILLSYQILMQGHLLKTLDKVDILFQRPLSVGMLDSAEEKIREIFEL